MEQLEKLAEFIMLNWEIIAEYFVICFAYFLIILFRTKIGAAKRDLGVIFKEKTQEVKNGDIALRKDVEANQEQMQKDLDAAKAAYQAAVDQIVDLMRRLDRAEKALHVIIDDFIYDTGDTGDTDNTDDYYDDSIITSAFEDFYEYLEEKVTEDVELHSVEAN